MRKVSFVFKDDAATGSPDSQEWHDWRAQGIGGSDAIHLAARAGLITDTPSWINGNKLFAQKLGIAKPTKVNRVMIRGQMLEDVARQRFEQKTGLVMRPVFGEMDSHPFIRASYDGMDFWKRILEIKCPSQEIHNMAKNGIVAHYYLPQLAQQLLVCHGEPKNWTGKEEIYFTTYLPEDEDGQDLAIVKLESQSLKPLAMRMMTVLTNFYNKWLSLRKLNLPEKLKSLEEQSKGLLTLMGEAKAIKSSAPDYIKEQLDKNKKTESAFHYIKEHPSKSSKVNEERLMQRLFWEKVPDEYKKPSTMVLRVNQPNIEFTSIEQAEEALIEAKQTIKQLEPALEEVKEKAKKIADQVGYLQGDYMSLYSKNNGYDWNLVCEDNNLNKADFMDSEPTFVRALKQKTKKQLELEAKKAEASAA